mgnify:CR=1 FL=1
MDVDRTANDHRNDGQSSDQTGHHGTQPNARQVFIQVGLAFVRVDLVDGFCNGQGFNTGDDFYQYIKDAFDVLYEEGQTQAKMLSIGLHCRIVGRPGRLKALARFLEYIAGYDDVWVCTRQQIAEHWLEHFPPKDV